MGNFLSDAAAASSTKIRAFYSSNAWIASEAEDQLRALAQHGTILEIAAFPDLHPGKYGPVGMAALSTHIHPHLIGSDIGCGMALFKTTLKPGKLRLDKAAKALRALEGPGPDPDHPALGTIGGGNHFCELLTLEEGRVEKGIYMLIHSGSRNFGGARLQDILGANSPLSFEEGALYLSLHVDAVRFAECNRAAIAGRAAKALKCTVELVADSPHNQLQITPQGQFIHRKGAANALGGMVPLAGSRDSHSYLLHVMDTSKALGSLSHGSGRRHSRAAMHGRFGKAKDALSALQTNAFGGRVLCEDRDLIQEEAGAAYKDVGQVVADLEAFGLAKPVAKFKPLLTYKVSKS